MAAAAEYESCRTTDQGINHGVVDLTYLRAVPVYSSVSMKNIRQIITENIRRRGWLILYTHDIELSPSLYGCTPQMFRDTLSLAMASGAEILSVANAVKRFRLLSS